MELRPYQVDDVAELLKHPAHGVFNEQRTGKTPTSIVAMDQKAEGRIVIVCPASMQLVWKSAVRLWTARPSFVLTGTVAKKNKLLLEWSTSDKGVAIISYDSVKATSKSGGMFLQLLKFKPIGLIVDEAHRLAGRKTKNFNAINNFRSIPHRLYLTGTPAPNHPSQVWSILHMIDPKTFTSYWKFVDEFFDTEEQRLPAYVSYKSGVSSVKQPMGFLPGKEQDYVQLLNRYSIMRKRKEVMPWLTDVPITRIFVEPNNHQVKHIESLLKYFKAEHIYTQSTLDQLIRVRQVCLDPGLLELQGSSPKTEWIQQYINDYPEKSILIFSKFTQYINKLKKELKCESDIGIITGEIPIHLRELYISKFQAGTNKVLLIQIDAGKEGLTLDRADVSIFTDVFPPVTDIAQARDRLVATSHERNTAKEIIELVLEGTYDEAIYIGFDSGLDFVDIANNYINHLKGGI